VSGQAALVALDLSLRIAVIGWWAKWESRAFCEISKDLSTPSFPPCGFSGCQQVRLRVVDLASGVVQDHQQILVAIIGKSGMLAAIDVLQHAREGAGAVSAAGVSLLRRATRPAPCSGCFTHL
jgi:hypothetical protein